MSIEIIKNRLYWYNDYKPPKSRSGAYYIYLDNEYEYQPFYDDFGPFNISEIHRFCKDLEFILLSPKYLRHAIYLYTKKNYARKANSILLICAFQIICLSKSSSEAWQPFISEDIIPFKDAGSQPSNYKCTILHCLEAIETALINGWYDYNNFNIDEYKFYEELENGDINWITPNLIAFSTPIDFKTMSNDIYTHNPEFYIPIFKNWNVKLVIRLNKREYDYRKFTKEGIRHLDLIYNDGTNPPEHILQKFLKECENEDGVIAVHCQAGLGRTGTLIACFLIMKYNIPASIAIAWIRMCRPGSIIGAQQFYLINKEKCLHKNSKSNTLPPISVDYGYVKEKYKKVDEEFPIKNYQSNQGRHLRKRKIRNKMSNNSFFNL